MICQGILSKNLAVHTVAAMLALADQHHCDMLKESCFEFIFSPNRLQDVVASQGYAELKTTCPSVLGCPHSGLETGLQTALLRLYRAQRAPACGTQR